MDQPIKPTSPDTQLIIDFLAKAEKEQIITYQQISAVIGFDIKDKYYLLATARKNLAKENILFISIRGIGIKRASDHDKVVQGCSRGRRSRNQLRKGVQELASIENYQSLSREDQVRHNLSLGVYGNLLQFTSAENMKKIEQAVRQENKPLDFTKTLELFQNNKKDPG